MFSIVEAAGWPIWFLVAASVIAVALIAERLVALRAPKIAPAELFNEVVVEYKLRGISDELLSRLQAGSPLGRIFAAGLKNIKSPTQVVKEAVEEAGRASVHELERFLTTLGTIASVSPLLGLFGTIVGMIEIFSAQNSVGNAPVALAYGIAIALYNTAFGLMVAIPSMIFYRHFRAKIDGLAIEMEQQAIKLIEVIDGARRD